MKQIAKSKRSNLMYQVIMHLILIAFIFAIFFLSSSNRVNGNSVKQQLIEKQIALFIEAGEPGMSFFLRRENVRGVINDIKLENNKIYVSINSADFGKGYGYFSRYDVNLGKSMEGYLIEIGQKFKELNE